MSVEVTLNNYSFKKFSDNHKRPQNSNLYVSLTCTIFCAGIKLLRHVNLMFTSIKAGPHSPKGSKFKKMKTVKKENIKSYNIE